MTIFSNFLKSAKGFDEKFVGIFVHAVGVPYSKACNRVSAIYDSVMRTGIWACLAILAALAGCQAPAHPLEPTAIELRIPDYERFVDATLTRLREYDFPPERVDREHGVIVTGRTTSKQWYEFWRIDGQTSYDLLESSLHTIGRIVTVTLEPLDAEREAAATAAGQPPEAARLYRLNVQVDKARYSATERQVTTTSGALSIYNERLPTTEGLRGAHSAGDHWVPLGRDGDLEAFLLAKLAALPEAGP